MAAPHTAMFSPAMFEQFNPETIGAAYATTAEHLRDLHRACFTTMQRSIDSGWDLAVQLPKCADTSEAVNLCTKWVSSRQEALATDTKIISEYMMKAWSVDPALVPTILRPNGTKPAGSHKVSAVTPAAAAE